MVEILNVINIKIIKDEKDANKSGDGIFVDVNDKNEVNVCNDKEKLTRARFDFICYLLLVLCF